MKKENREISCENCGRKPTLRWIYCVICFMKLPVELRSELYESDGEILKNAREFFRERNEMNDFWHVLPKNDLRGHQENARCDCKPRVENNLIIHNAFDGREMLETPIGEISLEKQN